MAASAISFLVTNLSTLIHKEVGLLCGVEEDMKKLSSTLSTILDVLDDAEMKQLKEKSIQNWLRKLKDAAYKVGDILDECETHALTREINGQNYASLKKVWTSAITCYPAVNLTFRHKIANRIKDMNEDLNAISEERKRFHLNEGFIGKGLALADDSRQTSSALPPLDVFGRQVDKEKIVKVLTEVVRDLDVLSVYPIIGMGGLGKTTVAQMIFNDERTDSHFVLKIWVYVSQNFNVKQVMKQIIESTPGEECTASSLDPLQKEVKKRLLGKRFLLVLDDAWSEDQEEWDKLKHPLASGSPGSCAVVTTRSEHVASIVRTLPTHYLSPLSQDDCWLLFRQRAFGPGNEEHPNLVNIGKEIVKKCGGVPLAAKSLGGLMRFKRGEEEWLDIVDSDLWDIPEGECSVMPALRLSYYNLPLELRHCFSFCAVFRKGSEIEKDKLIQLWMANGFISSKNKIEVEDVGNRIWNELYVRSFFLGEEKICDGNIYFKMHDLMHDLSSFVMGDECHMEEAQTSRSVSALTIRHVTLVQGMCRGELLKALKKRCYLHTILFQYGEFVFPPCSGCERSLRSIKLGSLRVLDGNGSETKKFLGSIGISKHLRYLNLSESSVKSLPASICRLVNLQTLNLSGCYRLQKLPNRMHCLRGLRHLFLVGCNKIKDMPPRLGKLTELKTLSLFVVGKRNGQRLGELQHLDLGGELNIKHLERVRNSIEAKEADLVGKPNLRIIRLYWEFSLEYLVVEQVIEALEPHPNVEKLVIKCYGGNKLPIWMGSPLILLVSIELLDCNNCLELPALWKLPCLKRLKMVRMKRMEYIHQNSSYTDGGFESLEELEIIDLPSLKELPVWMGNPSFLKNVVRIKLIDCKNCLGLPAIGQLPCLSYLEIEGMDKAEYLAQNGGEFPSLEILCIRYVPNLKGLVSIDEEEGQEQQEQQQQKRLLPRLKRLTIWRCLQLTLPTLPALENLVHWDGMNLNILNRISEHTSLTGLGLAGDCDLVCFPDEMFRNLIPLQSLTIHSLRKLRTLPGNMSNLVFLKILCICHCEELECLPDGGIGTLRSLLEMEISDCPKIVSLPDSIQNLIQLQSLTFLNCSLELKRRCENGSGEDWYKIAHVPNLNIT